MSRNYKFKVVGLNNDSSREELYLLTSEEDEAMLVAEILGDLSKKDLILRNELDGTKRPIDYVQVIKIDTNEIIWVSA